MKYLHRFTLLVVMIFSIITGLSGCATQSGNAYKAEHAAVTTVEVAMGAWNDYLGTHQVELKTEIKVRDAYEKYQSAMLIAIDASRAFSVSQTVEDQEKVSAAIANSQQVLADLVNLIRKLGGKL